MILRAGNLKGAPPARGLPILRWFFLALLLCLGAPRAQSFSVSAPERDVSTSTLEAIDRLVVAGLARISAQIPGTPKRSFAVLVHRHSRSMSQELIDSVHPGAPGFARLVEQEIHLILDDSHDLRNTIDHELVHILLHQYAGDAGLVIPRWFHEGLAQDLSGHTYLGASEEALVFRANTKTLIPFRTLTLGFPRDDEVLLRTAYGQSYSLVSFLHRRVGLGELLAVVRACSERRTFNQAFGEHMQRGLVHYEDEWVDYLIHESGAPLRLLLRNCFDYSMLLAVPVFFLALLRKLRREHAIRERLTRQDALEQRAAMPPEPAE